MEGYHCARCSKAVSSMSRRFKCEKCGSFFCVSCATRFCAFCKGTCNEIPAGKV